MGGTVASLAVSTTYLSVIMIIGRRRSARTPAPRRERGGIK
jgi:hypothetical protein